jgi:hypothetical protein
LPGTSQSWMKEMAGALLQPSAVLADLTPQKDGLAAVVDLSMYSGDPQPVNAKMLVTLSVRDASTIQVSVKPVSGGSQLVNGPLTTFTVPLGQLKSINTTPDCGDMALNVNVQLPVTFATNQTSNQSQVAQRPQSTLPASRTLADIQQPQTAYTTQNRATNTLESYVEIPAASLSALGRGIGSIPIDSARTAKNLRIRTQGNGLVILSDVYGSLGEIGTATTLVQPRAENGNLVMHVISTTLNVFIFSIPVNTYNQNLENMLNSNLGNAIAGKFTVDGVGVGGGTALPCAAADSLVLHGTTNLG